MYPAGKINPIDSLSGKVSNSNSYPYHCSYMSVESDKKSDIYENLIGEEIKKNSVYGSGLGKDSKPDSNIA